MKRIRYAGGEIVTGDSVATAVLEYAAALANGDRAERIEVPVAEPAGGSVEMLIGPASQVIAEPLADKEGGLDHFDDAGFVARMDRRTEEARRAWRPPVRTASLSDWDF